MIHMFNQITRTVRGVLGASIKCHNSCFLAMILIKERPKSILNRLLTSTVTMFIYLGSIDFVVCFQGDACNGCGHVAVDNSKDYQPTQNHDNSEKSSYYGYRSTIAVSDKKIDLKIVSNVHRVIRLGNNTRG